MYGEPDLADLLPAYYCAFVRRNQISIWKGICTHLLAMGCAIALCLGGFYYYQNTHMFSNKSFSVDKNEPITENTNKIFEEWTKPFDENNDELTTRNQIRKELDDLKKYVENLEMWRKNMKNVLRKLQTDIEINTDKKIEKALSVYNSDEIGLMDYAAIYAGGSIIETSDDTKPFPVYRPMSLFNLLKLDVLSSPEEMLRPCTLPGSCFAFWGSKAKITIKLARPIKIGAVSIGHASRLLLGEEGMQSAPKDFEIFGFEDELDDGVLIGKFTYDSMGNQHQTFILEQNLTNDKAYEMVELSILNNHGKEDFTCVYRFRIHGTPDSTIKGENEKKKYACC